jgi:hypothetical protein
MAPVEGFRTIGIVVVCMGESRTLMEWMEPGYHQEIFLLLAIVLYRT